MKWENGQIVMQDAESRMHRMRAAKMEKSIYPSEICMHALQAWHTLQSPKSYLIRRSSMQCLWVKTELGHGVSNDDVGRLVVGGYMYLMLWELPRFVVDETDNDTWQCVSLLAVSRQS